MDPFVLYGDLYKDVRKAVGTAVQSGQMEQLDQVTCNQVKNMYIYISICMYLHILTSSHCCACT
jgi:predicted nucleotidyltransferase